MISAFCRIGSIDPLPVLSALQSIPDAFSGDLWRRQLRHSPHQDSGVLILRGQPTENPRDVLHGLKVVDREIYLTEALHTAVLAVAARSGCRPARALIAKLPPRGKVLPHTDIGLYAEATERFHVALETNPEAWLEFAGERRHFEPGDIWSVDKHVPHCGGNDGKTPRMHLIVDVWAN